MPFEICVLGSQMVLSFFSLTWWKELTSSHRSILYWYYSHSYRLCSHDLIASQKANITFVIRFWHIQLEGHSYSGHGRMLWSRKVHQGKTKKIWIKYFLKLKNTCIHEHMEIYLCFFLLIIKPSFFRTMPALTMFSQKLLRLFSFLTLPHSNCNPHISYVDSILKIDKVTWLISSTS
jgi:hypothetical protein